MIWHCEICGLGPVEVSGPVVHQCRGFRVGRYDRNAIIAGLLDPAVRGLLGSRVDVLLAAVGEPPCGGCDARRVWVAQAEGWILETWGGVCNLIPHDIDEYGAMDYVCDKCNRPYHTTETQPRRACPIASVVWPPGPGTALKAAIAGWGFEVTDDCPCNAHARTMNEMGLEWCFANLDTITGWLVEEQQQQRRPHLAPVPRLAVRWFVWRTLRAHQRTAAAGA